MRPADAPRRRAARTVIDEIFRRVVTWLAPILCFTMEEAWTAALSRSRERASADFPRRRPPHWHAPALIEKWNRIRALRRVVTGALEIARRDKVIGASLEAAPVLYRFRSADADILQGHRSRRDRHHFGRPCRDRASRRPTPSACRMCRAWPPTFHHAEGDKCARCWMILPEVGKNPAHPDLCNRCAGAVIRGGAHEAPAISVW